ncbi:MAG TPA: Rieske 2Fe-2S domain-containing protein [Intrasporangium sp.]|uniref:Rieske (2Fe-2S) protein n=1 Tax=Intrasporangium sp. TaxID=1925024 RepID=UPI002D79F8D2|nr:Rieske 2Fe-2S domain-containing protein [Intrasporangium sp.]HET7398446.1 Rieske 2Fe-2S domain-containing protein [Intrasporangium sp.]
MTERPEVSDSSDRDGVPTRASTGSSRATTEPVERRGVLRAAGATGLLVLGGSSLAACGGSSSPGTTAPAASASSTPAGAGSSAETTSSGAGGAGGGIPAASVPVGGGAVFTDQKVVVTQPVAGTFKAFDTTCPHKGCAVATVTDKQIHCPCHGSAFDIATGARVAGPAPKGLTAKSVTVSGDQLTVT